MSAAHTERSRVRVGPRHGLETASLHVAKHSGSDMPAICVGGCSCLQAVAVGGCAPARPQPHAKQSKQPQRLGLCRHMLQVSCPTHRSHKLKGPESEKAPVDYTLQSASPQIRGALHQALPGARAGVTRTTHWMESVPFGPTHVAFP